MDNFPWLSVMLLVPLVGAALIVRAGIRAAAQTPTHQQTSQDSESG